MSRPGQTKEYQFGGNTYRISKFTPELACFWVQRMIGDLCKNAPELIEQSKQGGDVGGSAMVKLIHDFTRISKKDFFSFQKDCLSFVEVHYESGWHKFIGLDGTYPPGTTAPTLMALTVQSFAFSGLDFFDPALLKGLAELTGMGVEEEADPASSASPEIQNG